jgi:hypothetical protein
MWLAHMQLQGLRARRSRPTIRAIRPRSFVRQKALLLRRNKCPHSPRILIKQPLLRQNIAFEDLIPLKLSHAQQARGYNIAYRSKADRHLET